MRFLFFTMITFMLSNIAIIAQDFNIPLWEKNIPNLIVSDEVEKVIKDEIIIIKNVQNPDIAVYLPSKRNATGEAVIICPGGGYWILAYDWEGTDIAKALNAKGIAAIVLKYRLPTSNNNKVRHKSPLLDAQRAMRMVRFNAPKWNIERDEIGIMGFSAGGHLASTLSTHFDDGDKQNADSIEQMSCRPDFSILMYPVVSFTGEDIHVGSRKALLGDSATPEMIKYFSNELQVTDSTPPAFLVHSTDDKAVPVENSIVYYEALKRHNISAEMHIYPYGGHGFSLAIGKGHLEGWLNLCTDWIGYITGEK